MHEMKASGQKLHQAAAAQQSQQEEVDSIDQQIATLMGEIQKLEATRNHHRYIPIFHPQHDRRCCRDGSVERMTTHWHVSGRLHWHVGGRLQHALGS